MAPFVSQVDIRRKSARSRRIVQVESSTGPAAKSVTEGLRDEQVRLMRDEGGQVGHCQAGRIDGSFATLTSSLAAQRNTFQPVMVMAGHGASGFARSSGVQHPVIPMRPRREPSDPYTTGPIPCVSAGPPITAPAPSANRNAVDGSLRSRMSVARSDAITATYSAVPAHHVAADGERVAEAAARGRDVEGGCPLAAHQGRHLRGQRVHLGEMARDPALRSAASGCLIGRRSDPLTRRCVRLVSGLWRLV